MKKTTNRFFDILIPVIILIVLIFAFVGLNYHKLLTESFSSKKKLTSVKLREIDLKKKSKRLSNIYFLVRILIVVMLAALTLPLIYFDIINNIDDFVNFIELLFLLLAIISFLKYGKFSAIKKQINRTEESIRLWVYGKYSNIDEEIYKKSLEIERLRDTK